ncbi:fatty acid desaturase CarF family protein [Nannocystaceae bacterium ST9]
MTMFVLEVAAVLTFLLASVKIAVDIGQGVQAHGSWALAVVVLLPLGYVAADLFTGFFHFFADNFGSERTPILGPAFIFRFRQHHGDPKLICRLSFRELNGSHILCSMPFVIPLALAVPISTTAWGLALGTFGWSMMFFSVFTNQIHRWAHDDNPPFWVRPLQRTRILLSAEHHDVHHHLPHDVHFCITNGWLNVQLDRFGVWHHVADLLIALGVPQAPESVLGTARRREIAERRAAAGLAQHG